MSQRIKRIGVSGAGGQIAYSLLFRLAAGELLGPDCDISLHLLEVKEALQSLEGVAMELDDCAFPRLKGVKLGSNPAEVFEGMDYIFLIGAKPRGPGMERKDLLSDNGKIFTGQGRAIGEVAPRALVFVVGNPCNTNCLIALKNAKNMNPSQFFAMTRLDQNRGVSMVAKKAGVPLNAVTRMTIWGNHSSVQVPDLVNAKIDGKPALDFVDRAWYENEFFPAIQKRGAAVIAARGKSSAASAAQGALDGMKSLIYPTSKDDWFSMGVYSQGNPYNIDPDLIFSFPCRSSGDGKISIVKEVPWDAFLKEKIALVEQELIDERALVKGLL